MDERQRTYQHAAEVADYLLGLHLPVIGFETFDAGGYFGILLQLPNGQKHGLKCARDATREEVEATVRRALQVAA